MEKISHETYLTEIGKLTIYATPVELLKIEFTEDFVNADNGNKVTDLAAFQINDYAHGKKVPFTIPYKLEGTKFQLKVWNALLNIRYGETRSYSQIAKEIGHEKAIRAVGSACKANPLPIIVPCHRVIKSDGSVGNYVGGKDKKKKLLALEKGVYA